jgi:MFS family permease
MQVVAVNWQIYLHTSSALSLGFIGLARFLPVLFFSIFGGIASDTVNRRRLMFVTHLAMMGFSTVLAVTTFTGHINPLLIYLLIAGNSVASAFDTPARQSIVPLLVPKNYFMNAVSLNTILWQSAVVIGPSIAGFVIAISGVGIVYLLNALSFLAVIIALIAMNPLSQTVSKETGFSLKAVMEGLSFVRRSPIIYSTMFLDFFATFFSSATVLLPIFAKDILRVGPTGLGFLYAAPALGAVIAGLIVSSLGHLKNQGKILLSAVCLYGLATILFGISKSFYLSLLFLFLTGVGDVVSTIIRNTIRQLTTPDYLRGRMVSVNMIFFMGGPQLGEAEAGILAAAIGTPASVVVGGIGTIVATLILSYFIPKLKNYQGDEVLLSN